MSLNAQSRPSVQSSAISVTPHESRAAFSRARDFGLAVLPIGLCVAFDAARTFSLSMNVNLDHLYTGAMVNVLAQDRSVLFRLGMVVVFTLAIGASLKMLSALRQLEDWEEKQLRK